MKNTMIGRRGFLGLLLLFPAFGRLKPKKAVLKAVGRTRLRPGVCRTRLRPGVYCMEADISRYAPLYFDKRGHVTNLNQE